jgi:hypothetical protein
MNFFWIFLILWLVANSANAACSSSPVSWGSLSSNPNFSVTSTINGDSCTYSYQPGGKGFFNDSEIVKKPIHGKLEILNIYSFKYTANSNFNGSDNYAFKICGELNGKGCVLINVQAQVSNNGSGIENSKDIISQKNQNIDKSKVEQKQYLDTDKNKIDELKQKEIERLAGIEIEKKRQKEEAEQKERAAKEAELIRFAATEAEKQKQKEAVAARVAAIEAEKQRQKELEIERLAGIEIEKKRIREELDAKSKADAQRMVSIEAEKLRLKEEAEIKAKNQRLFELESELKRLKEDNSISKPPMQYQKEVSKIENDPLSSFEGRWVSVSPPVFYLIFNKVALGIRQVSLPNIGQGNIRLSDGAHGSNFQISAANLNCYYFVTFTNNRQKMVMELKAGESLCLQSSILEKAE